MERGKLNLFYLLGLFVVLSLGIYYLGFYQKNFYTSPIDVGEGSNSLPPCDQISVGDLGNERNDLKPAFSPDDVYFSPDGSANPDGVDIQLPNRIVIPIQTPHNGQCRDIVRNFLGFEEERYTYQLICPNWNPRCVLTSATIRVPYYKCQGYGERSYEAYVLTNEWRELTRYNHPVTECYPAKTKSIEVINRVRDVCGATCECAGDPGFTVCDQAWPIEYLKSYYSRENFFAFQFQNGTSVGGFMRIWKSIISEKTGDVRKDCAEDLSERLTSGWQIVGAEGCHKIVESPLVTTETIYFNP